MHCDPGNDVATAQALWILSLPMAKVIILSSWVVIRLCHRQALRHIHCLVPALVLFSNLKFHFDLDDLHCDRILVSNYILRIVFQVLFQMHGAPAEEQDGDADHQEDAQQGLREHGRPKSGINLVEQATGHTATASHRGGRPPLAETTSTNRHGFKVRTLLLLPVSVAQLGHACLHRMCKRPQHCS